MRFNPGNTLDISDCGEKVKKIISEHLKSSGVISWIEPLTLFEEDFEIKLQSKMSDEAMASSMEHAIKNTINIKMDENPVYYTGLLEKLQQILEETKGDWTTQKIRLKDFINREMEKGEESRADDLGLTTKEFAVFETLRKLLEDGEVKGDSIKEEDALYMSESMLDFNKEFAKDFNKAMTEEWFMAGWAENQAKTSQIGTKIYLFVIGRQQKIREVYGAETLSRLKILSDKLLNLAKNNYAALE